MKRPLRATPSTSRIHSSEESDASQEAPPKGLIGIVSFKPVAAVRQIQWAPSAFPSLLPAATEPAARARGNASRRSPALVGVFLTLGQQGMFQASTNRPQVAHLGVASRVGHCDVNTVLVNIQSDVLV